MFIGLPPFFEKEIISVVIILFSFTSFLCGHFFGRNQAPDGAYPSGSIFDIKEISNACAGERGGHYPDLEKRLYRI